MIRASVIVATAALTACGETDQDSIGNRVIGLIVESREETPAPTQTAVTEEEILSSRGKYLRVNVRELQRWDTMIQAGSNDDRVTWVDSANFALTLDDGIVVATRGLSRDLMGAEARGTAQALRAGGGTVMRQHDYLDDQDQIVTRILTCQIEKIGAEEVNRLGQTLAATRYEEQCVSDDLSLSNIFWLSSGRGIVRSLQAVSPDAGYLQIDVF